MSSSSVMRSSTSGIRPSSFFWKSFGPLGFARSSFWDSDANWLWASLTWVRYSFLLSAALSDCSVLSPPPPPLDSSSSPPHADEAERHDDHREQGGEPAGAPRAGWHLGVVLGLLRWWCASAVPL